MLENLQRLETGLRLTGTSSEENALLLLCALRPIQSPCPCTDLLSRAAAPSPSTMDGIGASTWV